MFYRKKKILKIFLFAIFTLGSILFFSQTVFAQSASLDLGLNQVSSTIGLPTTDIRLIVARIIKTILGLLGIAAVVIIIYGGFVWMTAGGNEENVGKAKKILVNAVIGLVIILSSYAIVSFVMSKLLEATSSYPSHCYNSIQDGDELDVDCGGSCMSCDGGGGGFGGGGSSALYIKDISPGKKYCISNVGLWIRFSRDVDINTLGSSVAVQKQISSSTYETTGVPGIWSYGQSGSTTDYGLAIFKPSPGYCAPTSNCYQSNTKYRLTFLGSPAGSGIKSKSTPAKSLICSIGKGCRDIEFETGESVDLVDPAVKIDYPTIGSSFQQGQTVPVNISATDNIAVQDISLKVDNVNIGNYSLSGDECIKSVSTTINWSTSGFATGTRKLLATAMDQATNSDSVTSSVVLRPSHCFDTTLDSPGEILAGPPACGPACGSCAGASCTSNAECSSGYCINGRCSDSMYVTGFSPDSGAKGTYVTINGYYFGKNEGKVFFPIVSSAVSSSPSQWTQATVVNCGVSGWKDTQIIVEVPTGAVSGPIMVETASTTVGTTSLKFVDLTNDQRGPLLGIFTVNTLVRPGLCRVDPAKGDPGDFVKLYGVNLAFVGPEKAIYFGSSSAISGSWSHNIISDVKVPALEKGTVAVKVFANRNNGSNAIGFDITEGISSTTPVITYISPDNGALGEYITIVGRNFGSKQGKIYFNYNGTGIDNLGSLMFPTECVNDVWKDDQIIVKFPNIGSLSKGKYAVKVITEKGDPSPLYYSFTYSTESPNPGICKISPSSGPVPFTSTLTGMKIMGEYFNSTPSSSVYFWTTGASATGITGRLKAANTVVSISSNSSTADTVSFSTPPANTISGPVVVYRPGDSKMSNPAKFTVVDCVKNNNKCSGTDHCCATGNDAGLCRAEGDLCDGETKGTAYMWRFCTKDIPKVPRVVERCDSSVDNGKAMPSPSPSILWDTTNHINDHENTCLNALLNIEFSMVMNSSTELHVYQCIDANKVDSSTISCGSGGETEISLKSFVSGMINSGKYVPKIAGNDSSYLELFINTSTNKWGSNTWYRVVLGDKFNTGFGTSTAYLAKDRSCGANTAYCFMFKTGDQDCKMKKVIVVPSTFLTNYLEAPMKYHTSGGGMFDLFYSGHGLSDQKCIVMDSSGFDWKWSSASSTYADIYSGTSTQSQAKISALSNTYGAGLTNPDDAVDIKANASTSTSGGLKSFEGVSPLTIDLSNPQVIDYWPKCLEACTNAEVAVQFNTSISKKNIIYNNAPYAAENHVVQLLECLDENCLTYIDVADSSEIFLNDKDGGDIDTTYSSYSVLKIANARLASSGLKPNKLYKVVVSASSTSYNDQRLLWSMKTILQSNNPTNYNKPMTTQFSWKFKTKKEKCVINKVDVSPSSFAAFLYNDRQTYNVQSYSSPDSCDANGQKLNPWEVSWKWESSDKLVATVLTTSTQATNKFCTKDCILKGSVISAGLAVNYPVCGNSVKEAGEDCDPPNSAVKCGLNCLLSGNTQTTCGNGVVEKNYGETCDPGNTATAIGCSTSTCLRLGSSQELNSRSVSSSICGNGYMGSGEDCDLGIDASTTDSNSSLGCSSNCLHVGTRLSTKWCYNNDLDHGGFSTTTFDNACNIAYSQCGDGVTSPDEDSGCDLGQGVASSTCNAYCLKKSTKVPECNTGDDGCDIYGQHLGASLDYKVPSVCGDGNVGSGEDDFCETKLSETHKGMFDPWSLATGVGMGVAQGTPPQMSADIKATYQQKSGSGKFVIPCGYSQDSDCPGNKGNSKNAWGVATDSCCYLRPKLTKVYPGSTSTIESDICPNTAIEVGFDTPMDSQTFSGNFVVARGIGSEYLSAPATVGTFSSGASSLAISGNKLFLTGSAGLKIVDISNPKLLKLTTSTNFNITAVSVGSKYIYAAAASKGLQIIDVSSSSNPIIISSSTSAGVSINDVFVSGNYVYATAGGSGLRIFDVSSSTNPTEVGTLSASSVNFIRVVSDGTKIYVLGSDSAGGLIKYFYVIDKTDVKNPFIAAVVTSTKNFQDLQISETYAYVAAGSDGLRIFDVSNISNIVEISAAGSGATYRRVEIIGDYAYLSSDRGLRVISVSDPTSPKEQAIITGTGNYLDVQISGQYALVSGVNSVLTIDVAKYALDCSGGDDVTNLLATISVKETRGLFWYEKLWNKVAGFVKKVFGLDIAVAAPRPLPIKWCVGKDLGVVSAPPGQLTGEKRFKMSLSAPLALDTDYAILLKEKIKDKRGISIGYANTTLKTNIKWKFITDDQICEIKKVEVTPSYAYLSKVGATTTLEANGYSAKSEMLQPIVGYYNWQYDWAPQINDYIDLQNTTSTYNEITANNRNGELYVTASANVVENKYTTASGIVASGKAKILVYLCENPWPKKSPLLLPYEDKYGNNDNYSLITPIGFDGKSLPASTIVTDGYFNFSTYYCADSGNGGDTTDDLPYLQPVVKSGEDVLTNTTTLKIFYLYNEKNSDVIGVQVFPNNNHLKVADWYAKDYSYGGKGFSGSMQSLTIDGYDAIYDGGYNYYIDALNYTSTTPGKGSIYSNIYLFSINSNANSETLNVFSQIMKNLKFNVNLSNYGYCGKDMDNPGVTTTCKNDLDCSSGEICSAQTDKLKRNYKRLRDLASLQSTFEGDNERLVGYWTMDKLDASGKNVYDKSGYGNNGLANWTKPSSTAGVVGEAMKFNGTSDFINLGNPIAFPYGMEARTICAWGKPMTTSSGYFKHLFVYGPANFTPYKGMFIGKLGLDLYGGANNSDLSYKDFWKVGVWGHACLTYDGTIAKLYANGVLASSKQVFWNLSKGGAQIGKQIGQTQYWDGAIDEVRIYSRALSANDISDLYTSASAVSSFPSISEDSYLKGQSISTWSSWTKLGSAVSQSALATDPINELGKAGTCTLFPTYYCRIDKDCDNKGGVGSTSTCTLHDPTTGWSTANMRLSFACAADSFAYRYFAASSTGYAIRSNFEKPFYPTSTQTAIINWGAFVDDFIDSNRYSTNGICLQNEEISVNKIQKCGDLTITAGVEACDPPNKVISRDDSKCSIGGSVTVSTCNSSCDKIEYTTEVCPKECGKNGWQKNLGEICDDDLLNGTYNHCNTTCTGLVGNPPGYCGDGELNPSYEVCDPSSDGHPQYEKGLHKYGLDLYAQFKKNSCRADCQDYGPYCGDSIIQEEHEVCDNNTVTCTTTESLIGTKKCSSDCKEFNACTTTLTVAVTATSSVCGDGVWDQKTEACDASDTKSSFVKKCEYGNQCSECVGCKIVSSELTDYCGDGKISGPEVCEIVNNKIFAAVSSSATLSKKNEDRNGFEVLSCLQSPNVWPQTIAKGEKKCVNKCMKIDTSGCIYCGLKDSGGVKVAGGIINVLDPTSKNPLLAGKPTPLIKSLVECATLETPNKFNHFCNTSSTLSLGPNGGMFVFMQTSTPKVTMGIFSYGFNKANDKYSLETKIDSKEDIYLNSDPICSSGTPKYLSIINNHDNTNGHVFGFPITSAEDDSQFDLVLSPLILNSYPQVYKDKKYDVKYPSYDFARPNDVRVVLVWKGNDDFRGGFMVTTSIAMEGASFVNKVTTGTDYFLKDSKPKYGLWYHGFGWTDSGTNVESFTLNASALTTPCPFFMCPNPNRYKFYVRLAEDSKISGIYSKKLSDLEVRVYLPETSNQWDFYRIFALPTYVFKLSDITSGGSSAGAKYWHVFNIQNSVSSITTSSEIVTKVVDFN